MGEMTGWVRLPGGGGCEKGGWGGRSDERGGRAKGGACGSGPMGLQDKSSSRERSNCTIMSTIGRVVGLEEHEGCLKGLDT